MIVLDTNVLSEPVRAHPDAAVLNWLASLTEPLALTSVSIGELLTGVELLPGGHRRTGLLEAIESLLAVHAGNVLPYDERAARRYAELAASRRREGRPLSVEDGMIAGICLANGAALATRNVKDFESLGLELIDPWAHRAD